MRKKLHNHNDTEQKVKSVENFDLIYSWGERADGGKNALCVCVCV